MAYPYSGYTYISKSTPSVNLYLINSKSKFRFKTLFTFYFSIIVTFIRWIFFEIACPIHFNATKKKKNTNIFFFHLLTEYRLVVYG